LLRFTLDEYEVELDALVECCFNFNTSEGLRSEKESKFREVGSEGRGGRDGDMFDGEGATGEGLL
jgi:hypothetical protein